MFSEVEIFISASENLVFTTVVSNNKVIDLKAERRNERKLIGSIFKGVVKKVCKSLDGYFIDIGLDKEAFIQEKDIRKKLKVGDTVIVQLRRKDTQLKGSKATCKISIPGKYLVYFPEIRKLKISGRLKNFPYADELKKLIEKELKEREGVIIRASAIRAKEGEILDELNSLRNVWRYILEQERKLSKGILYEEFPTYARVIRDYWSFIKEICVDNADIWKEIHDLFGKDIRDKLRFSRNLDKLTKNFSIYQLLSKLLSKYVWLKGGGFIVIEQTEAMVVIDVNSGEGCGESLEENALKTNIEALEEIAHQIKLRNLAGMIVIDLIDLKREENRKKLLKEAEKIFRKENLNVKIYGITKLGLLELTRKKDSESLYEVLGESCPSCNGKGFVKSKEFILYLIEKEIEKNIGKRLELRVHPRVFNDVKEFVKRKNLKEWITIKEVWNENVDYYQLLFSEY
ncbi:MAG TPA: Rne/Rng family ribonuclease [Aquifex aeolicus]|nr:Rne/Rng family ribonuclease [Aquifex aeolicus]